MSRTTRRTALALAWMLPATVPAQQKLVGGWELSVTPTSDRFTFGTPLTQPVTSDGGGVIRSVQQLSAPVRVHGSLGSSWALDVSTAFARSSVDGTRGTSDVTRELSGLADIRVRATGQLVRDRVLLSIGANIPTGRTELDAEELAVARAVGSPALGMSVPVLGLGGGASAGLVLAQPVADGRWALAGGVSYEYRASFSPVAVGTGLVAPDFSPSGVVRVSAGLDGLVGEHAMTINVGADVFADDRLAFGNSGGAEITSRLGPVLSFDWELRPATTRLRDVAFFVSDRYRTAFSRGGTTVANSAGNYLDAGARVGFPVATRGTLLVTVSARLQSGLDFEATLPTAAARLGVLDVRYAWRSAGGASLAPFVRLQAGTIEQGTQSTSATGLSLGLSLGALR
ncbi:MAG: hypothetical protein MUF00_03385 [Gemmatimonadaceae bacterium]|jgi:hypothetical protein|nr:hypothetical protein [Gemmatimonadaceae bacterium]